MSGWPVGYITISIDGLAANKNLQLFRTDGPSQTKRL